MEYIALGILAVLFVGFVLALLLGRRGRKRGPSEWFTPEYKRVGNRGEKAAAEIIRSVLREGDHLLTNVSIEYNGHPAELDCVVVNSCGVFIIEVKNYTGRLVGGEDDYKWRKIKTTRAGNTYESEDKNPIRQVKRQVWILAKYLKYHGADAWVSGYAILLHGNSPVESDCVLRSTADIDRAIHTPGRTVLSAERVEAIAKLLG